MTNREIKQLYAIISPQKDGFISGYTKSELSDLVYETTGLELEEYQQEGKSAGKMLHSLLLAESTELTTPLVKILKEIK